MTMPRPDEQAKTLFHDVLPADPRVTARPMFGQMAGFVNGAMFTGLYGNALFVRLPEEERDALLREEGAEPFAPMAGRPMREYVVLPSAWSAEPGRIRPWVERALAWTATLPPKPAKASGGRRAKKA